MSDLAELIIDVKQKQTIKQLDNVQKKLNSLQSSAKDVGTAFLAGWSFTKIINLFNSFGQLFAKQQVAVVRFSNIFSNSMGTAQAAVQRLQDKFSQTETAAKSILASFGGKIIQLGFDQSTTAKLSSQLSVLAQNASVAFGKSLNDQMINKFTNAILGQTKGLRQVGIIINTNTQSFKQQIQYLQNTKGLTEEQAKAQAIINEMLKQGQKYSGAAQAKIKSISNSLQSLRNTFNDLVGSEIGKILSTIFNPILTILQNILKLPYVATITAWTLVLGSFYTLWLLIKKVLGVVGKYTLSYINSKLKQMNNLQLAYNSLVNKGLVFTKANLNLLKKQVMELKRQRWLTLEINRLKASGAKENIANLIAQARFGALENLQKDYGRDNLVKNMVQLPQTPTEFDYANTAKDGLHSLQYLLTTSSSVLLNTLAFNFSGIFSTISELIDKDTKILHGNLGKFITRAFTFGSTVYSAIAKSVDKIVSTIINGFVVGSATGAGLEKATEKVGEKVAAKAAAWAAGSTVLTKIGLWFTKFWGVIQTGMSFLWSQLVALGAAILKGVSFILGIFTAAITWIILGIVAIIVVLITKIASKLTHGYSDYYLEKMFAPFWNWYYEVDKQKEKITKAQAELAKKQKERAELNAKYAKELEKVLADYNSFLNLNITPKKRNENWEFDTVTKALPQSRKLANDAYAAYLTSLVQSQDESLPLKQRVQAAKKLKQQYDAYLTAQNKVYELQQNVYKNKLDYWTQIQQLTDNYNSAMQPFLKQTMSSADLRDWKIQNLKEKMKKITELFNLDFNKVTDGVTDNFNTELSKLTPQDQIKYWKEYRNLFIQQQQLKIDGLKEQMTLVQQTRQFINGIIGKLLQFKTQSVSGIQVNTTQGYKFATSSISSTGSLNDSLTKSANDTSRIKSEVQKIRKAAQTGLNNINNNLKTLIQKTTTVTRLVSLNK